MDKQTVCKTVLERDCRFKSYSLHQWVGSLTAKHWTVNPEDCGSNPLQPYNAQVMELVYMLGLDPRFWGFESLPGYQIGLWCSGLALRSPKPLTLVQIQADLPHTTCSVMESTPDCLSGRGVQIPQVVPCVLGVNGSIPGFQPGGVSSSLIGRFLCDSCWWSGTWSAKPWFGVQFPTVTPNVFN